ncbi:MAG: threonine-phosphate decarboxylase CobD [Methyloceanibacter sp.]|uniref:threonine-phosphate decarboxylase CobD n=1 Tax=Methyloceanibacter sp. TaxID=1965321 RepID=UPI003D6D64A4
MIPPSALEPLSHGGDLDAARKLFPGAPEPFLDLSTGINPHPYPIPPFAPELFSQLPEPAALERLKALAAAFYGAPSAGNVVCAPGSQILVALSAGFVPPGRAIVLGPTYAEHARAAELAGHEVSTVSALEALGDGDLAIVVNPNNPDGRVVARQELLSLAARLRGRDGLLVVDEAFMDVGPSEEGLSSAVDCGNVVVLRSLGKSFGLAGLRLSFALAAPDLAARLGANLGPWPVSGVALAIGSRALADRRWIETTRISLAAAAARLNTMLQANGLEVVGGTALFRLVRTDEASLLFDRLGRAGIFVRRFAYEPQWLRFGLPGAEPEWQRLEAALRG